MKTNVVSRARTYGQSLQWARLAIGAGTVAVLALAAPSTASADCALSTQCDSNALRNVPANSCNKSAQMTTCGDPLSGLTYRVFLNLHRPLLFARLAQLDAKEKRLDGAYKQWEGGTAVVTSTNSIIDALGVQGTKEALTAYMGALSQFGVGTETTKAIASELLDGAAVAIDQKGMPLYVATKVSGILVNSFAAWSINQITDYRIDLLDADTFLEETFHGCRSPSTGLKIAAKLARLPSDRAKRFKDEIDSGIRAVDAAASSIHGKCSAQCSKPVCAANAKASQSCAVANGAGASVSTCASDGSRWLASGCGAVSCNRGFRLSGSACVK